MIKSIVLSSGHGKYIRGASGIIDEVDEARLVVEEVAKYLRRLGVEVVTYHDDVSKTQNENLNRIVDFHNSCVRDLDVSVHFNAYVPTSKPMGCEVLYVSQKDLAADLSATLAYAAGFIDRGAKYRSDLFFLNKTAKPAVLLEICFVDSDSDVSLYKTNFDELCVAIAETLAGPTEEEEEDEEDALEPPVVETSFEGKCSWFGGPDDMGVSPSEGLAFIYSYDTAPNLFLPKQPPGTTGLARRLDPSVYYVACRWDYSITPKPMLADQNIMALVRSNKTGRSFLAHPSDWGPNEKTGRIADLSPGLLEALGLKTDDEVEVIYPAPEPEEDAVS